MMDQMLQCDEKWKRDVLSLFLFYCYTAVWQKTFTPKCTTTYASKALNMSVRSLRRAKAELIRLGMIEEVTKHGLNKAGKNSIYYYIRVHYFENKTAPSRNRRDHKSEPLEKTPPKCLQANKETTNVVPKCLRDPKEPLYRSAAKKRRSDGEKTLGLPNSKNKTPDISKKYKLANNIAKKLQHALAHHNWINFTPKLDVWTKEIIKLHDADLHPVKFKDMKIAIQWLKDHGNELYCPVPRDAKQFVSKYPTIMRQINKDKLEVNNTEDEIDYDKPNSSNLCSNSYPCQSCHRSDINVYQIILPNTICDISNLCRKCFKKKINEGL